MLPPERPHHYTFGDSDLAAERLALLAKVYEPTTVHLLEQLPATSAPSAIDLGCGPGYTTELVGTILGASRVWGLDASARMIERARARLGAVYVFATHDITTAPYPVGGADVAFARHVLTHLASPRAVLAAAAEAIRVGGYLALEENCALESAEPLFNDYYARVAAMQRHYGQEMYIGRDLPRLAAGTPWAVEHYEQTRAELDPRAMARLHAMNVRTWSRDPYAVASFEPGGLDAMTRALDAVASGTRVAGPVSCLLGQATLRRT